ncbi:UNVERIFIED_CONTAM: hypothetical protein GTU68_035121 [Idotea baltica]|nr:hypothetical protein [Idotea baltica]
MILLGGVTRLTNSGLSMVEWKPLIGIVPPLSEQAWLEMFEKYKQFPEYRKLNLGMSLEGFKSIFMYEYLHRVLGRLIGVIFLLPFLYFLAKGRLRSGLVPNLLLMFFLGGLQGLLGWYMVKSGLVDNPHVSQYRLTAHLGLAVVIYTYMLWVAFGLLAARSGANNARAKRLVPWSVVLVGLLFCMILTGGLVAGTRAGLAYNTWPLMGTSFIPAGLYSTSPAWLAMFEDITTIQFNHRMFAYFLVLAISVFSWQAYQAGLSRRSKVAVALLLAALFMQVSLGISTLLLHVPVAIAAAHQGGAILTLTAALYLSHCLYRYES